MSKHRAVRITVATAAAALGTAFAATSSSAKTEPTIWCQHNPYVQAVECHSHRHVAKTAAKRTTVHPKRRVIAISCRNPYTGAVVSCF